MTSGVFAHWPNRITALRFFGATVLFVLLALQGDAPEPALASREIELQVAVWLFIASRLSDVLDGWLARRGNLITAFGRIADPFVDKVLVLGTMIFLVDLPWSQRFFPPWIVVVILAREFLVTAIRGYVEKLGVEFPADWFGKTKMFLQCSAVGIVMGLAAFQLSEATEHWWGVVGELFVWATLLTSLGSGLSYVLKTRRILAGRTA